MRLVLTLTFGLVMTAPATCDEQSSASQAYSNVVRRAHPAVQVILDVFSGRPNPSWTLSSDEERELGLRLQGLPPSSAPAAATDLGYRGFRLVTPSAGSSLPPEVIVANGTVSVRDAAGLRHYADRGGIEAWLRDLARRHGHGTLLGEP